MSSELATPKTIEGGCLCGALRYRVEFPEDHDFQTASNTCQCTQCRRQTGSLFLFTHRIRPASALTFTTETSTLKHYAAGPSAVRGFCGECGSFLYWKPNSDAYTCLTIGTIDPLYLFGEGADGTTVPKGGYSAALASGGGHHLFCANDIPGVTDNMPLLLAQGGTRWPGDNE